MAGVVIVGMHRSGTSAIAGYLARAGYFAGGEEDLLPPAEDNPKGFFEREDVNALNDELFASLGGAWDKPPARGLVEEVAGEWSERARRLLETLDDAAGGRPVVLKDPRISLALPVWGAALEAADFAWLLVDRSPVDTALSVRKRDGRPLSVALALWQIYSTELLASLAGHRVLVVHYEDFVEAPEEKGSALLSWLGTAETVDAARAKGFVSADMRHHRTSLDDPLSAEALTVQQMALARWLAALPEGWVELDPPAGLRRQSEPALVAATEYYDAMGDRHGMEAAYNNERHRSLHFEQATELKDRHIESIEEALETAAKRSEGDAARIAALEGEVVRLETENTELSKDLRRLTEDGLAAASNLLAVAKKSWRG